MSAQQHSIKRRKSIDHIVQSSHAATNRSASLNAQSLSFPKLGADPKSFHADWLKFADNVFNSQSQAAPTCNCSLDIATAPRSESISTSASMETECKTNETPNESAQHIANLKQQNESLQRQMTTLRDQIEQAQKNERKYQQLYRTELREKDRYKLRLKSLAQMIKTGQKPHFDRVSMHKMNPICTERIHEIKHNIKIAHSAKNKFKVDITGHTQHKWMAKKSLAQIIKKHHKHNLKHNPSKPDILINKSRIPYNFVFKCYRIKKDKHRIKALASGYQRGLKALIDIPKGTVIGQYIGVEYTMDEWQSVFSHSNEEAVRNTYAFDVMINVAIMANNQCSEYKEEEMVIDGYGLREKIMEHERVGNGTICPYSAHLLYINDCRADISIDYPTGEDSKYWNVDFVEAVINGFPAVFLITRCAVKRGEELMSYYGESYDVALKQQTEYQRMQNCVISLVDKSILHGVDLSGDIWTLD